MGPSERGDPAERHKEYVGYITSRGFLLPRSKAGLEKGIWFNLWERKMWPYQELLCGDTLYWHESPTKTVVWKSRVTQLDRFPYADKESAASRIRSQLGEFNKDQDYFHNAAPRGYCIAYKVKAVDRIDRRKPPEISMPHLGWLRVDETVATNWLRETYAPMGTTLEDIEPPSKDPLGWLRRVDEKMQDVSPRRCQSLVEYWARGDSQMVRAMKQACNYACQFPACGVRIRTRGGGYYIEVAHIEPIHEGGKSRLGNLVVLCPNHHKEFDYGNRVIEEQTLESIRGTLNGRSFEIRLPTAAS